MGSYSSCSLSCTVLWSLRLLSQEQLCSVWWPRLRACRSPPSPAVCIVEASRIILWSRCSAGGRAVVWKWCVLRLPTARWPEQKLVARIGGEERVVIPKCLEGGNVVGMGVAQHTPGGTEGQGTSFTAHHRLPWGASVSSSSSCPSSDFIYGLFLGWCWGQGMDPFQSFPGCVLKGWGQSYLPFWGHYEYFLAWLRPCVSILFSPCTTLQTGDLLRISDSSQGSEKCKSHKSTWQELHISQT